MSAELLAHSSVRSQRYCRNLLIACVLVGAAANQLGRWVEAEILKRAEVGVGALTISTVALASDVRANQPGLLNAAESGVTATDSLRKIEETKTASIIASASLDISAVGETHWLSEQWESITRGFGL